MTPTVKPEPPVDHQINDSDAFGVSVGDADGGVVTVSVRGDLDMLTAPAVAETVERAQTGHSVLLDLSEVSFLGSIGLSILVDATRRADEAQRKFAIVASNRIVLRAVEVTGLDVVLAIFPDRAQAEQHLRA